MKKPIIAILAFVVCVVSTAGMAERLNSIEKEKRKIVSRIYQITDGALLRCTGISNYELEKTVNDFKKVYPKLNRQIKESRYYQYAVDSFSQQPENTPEDKHMECGIYQSLLVSMMDKEESRKKLNQMSGVLDQEELARWNPVNAVQPPHLWSDHKLLAVPVNVCFDRGQRALDSLGYSAIKKKGYFSYAKKENNSAIIKCVALGNNSFVYLAVAGPDWQEVKKLRNDLYKSTTSD